MTTNQCTDQQFALEIRRALIMIARALQKRYGIGVFLIILKGEIKQENKEINNTLGG